MVLYAIRSGERIGVFSLWQYVSTRVISCQNAQGETF
ncbi:MAG: viroplasmin family protein [Paludibacteraceae bacterium]|nr:viroplasmin family protein [Paludibacteraceae bacterium]